VPWKDVCVYQLLLQQDFYELADMQLELPYPPLPNPSLHQLHKLQEINNSIYVSSDLLKIVNLTVLTTEMLCGKV
jgi:hypothetical protein